LFKSSDADGMAQPITTQPRVVFAPGGGYVVLFGTGKLLETADTVPGNFHPQSFYAIYDSGNPKDKVAGRSDLATRKLIKSEEGLIVSGNAFSYGSGTASKGGWYVDFLDSDKSGERSVSNALLANGRLFFNTIIPGGDPCIGGGGRTYSLDVLTGLSPENVVTGWMSTVGLLGAPTLFEVGAPAAGERNAVGLRTVVKRYSVVNMGSEGVAPAKVGTNVVAAPAGRFSWREILNWLELKSSAKNK
jgi:type IV pilus assembly protein PilY1